MRHHTDTPNTYTNTHSPHVLIEHKRYKLNSHWSRTTYGLYTHTGYKPPLSGLTRYADSLSGTYSGGTLKKLSLAVALIGTFGWPKNCPRKYSMQINSVQVRPWLNARTSWHWNEYNDCIYWYPTTFHLVGDPPVLLLDEPSASVDPSSRRVLWKLLRQLIESGKSVLVSSHIKVRIQLLFKSFI